MKTIVVTGGAGLIGSHLVDSLVKDYKVICVDNLCTGAKDNIKHLLELPNFEFLEHDIKKEITLEDDVDYIFHLASRASPRDYQQNPLDTLLTNALGTYNMLNLAKEKQARFLFTSTSEVYGDPLEHPQKETDWGNVSCTGARSCYDEAKRFAESMIIFFSKKFNLGIRIARLFNTFGPRMNKDDGRVIPNFITQTLRGDPITIHGTGAQTRSFAYVSDIIAGLKTLMLHEIPLQKINGDPLNCVFNLGSQNEISVADLANLIKNMTSSTSEIVFEVADEDDPTRRRPDITKAREVLGWAPQVSMESGLNKTIEYFKSTI